MQLIMPPPGICKIGFDGSGNWQLLPPDGKVVRIGDLDTPQYAADNDSLFVGNDLELGSQQGQSSTFYGKQMELRTQFRLFAFGAYSYLRLKYWFEEITIPVGQGSAGVLSTGNAFFDGTLVFAVGARVTQAPGGGATSWSLRREGAAGPEFAQNRPVTLGTLANWYSHFYTGYDKVLFQTANQRMQVNTNLNVTISDMKVRVVHIYWLLEPPSQ